MDLFTVEEINLICIFSRNDRNMLIAEINESLPYVYEPDFIELMHCVKNKLERITDEEFAAISFYPADEADVMEG